MDRATPLSRSELQDLLPASRGYAVFDRHGKRVGGFIEAVGTRSEEFAIREERVFLAHRRVLPSSIVAAVLPEERAVLLAVDRRALARASEAESHASDERQNPDLENWQHRIARYVSVTETDNDQNADQSNADSHLLFVSTPDGYELIERAGVPPAPFEEVELPEHETPFHVVKLADSPLPNDRRVCAYLEPAGLRPVQQPE